MRFGHGGANTNENAVLTSHGFWLVAPSEAQMKRYDASTCAWEGHEGRLAPMKELAACLLALAFPRLAAALGPHEVLVVVNGNSPRSVEVAEEFVRLRKVPEANVVRLALPEAGKVPMEISGREFGEKIWEPARRAAEDRGVSDHILAWVYSVDFPVRISGTPPMSVLGLTLLRNRPPDPEAVNAAAYVSPLFAGPDARGLKGLLPQSFETIADWLGADAPLPSMMLGFMGENGNTRDELVRCLRTGAASDGTRPTGTVYYVLSPDIRSTCRDWQFKAAREELARRGVEAVAASNFPAARRDVLGLMMGSAAADPAQVGRYLPGCMADNLTSAGAVFDNPDQTKISAWIAAGATAAAGTVTEPYSNWRKFSNGRLFAHYASGCTVMESYYQAIRCPLQLLIVGDPLARPWAPKDTVGIVGLGEGPVSGVVEVKAVVESAASYPQCTWLLDGRVLQKGRDAATFKLDTANLKPGRHTLRVVAYSAGTLKNQVFDEREFVAARDAK